MAAMHEATHDTHAIQPFVATTLLIVNVRFRSGRVTPCHGRLSTTEGTLAMPVVTRVKWGGSRRDGTGPHRAGPHSGDGVGLVNVLPPHGRLGAEDAGQVCVEVLVLVDGAPGVLQVVEVEGRRVHLPSSSGPPWPGAGSLPPGCWRSRISGVLVEGLSSHGVTIISHQVAFELHC